MKSGSVAYGLSVLVFLALTTQLAIQIQNPGTVDSMNNLETARNLAGGQGLTSHLVQQYFFDQPLPNPENIRPAGAPALMAWIYLLAGQQYSWHVLLNGAVMLLSSWLVHEIIRSRYDKGAAGWGACTFLLASQYEMASYWNNNLLTVSTALLLWSSLCLPPGRRRTLVLVLASACGFWTKPTFALSAAAVTLICYFGPDSQPRSWRPFLTYCVLTLTLVVPFFIRNYQCNGTLVPPLASMRLAERYGLVKDARFTSHMPNTYAYRIGNPVTWSYILQVHGVAGVLAVEADNWKLTGRYLLLQNVPFSILLLAGAYRLQRDRQIRLLALLAASMVEPIFSNVFLWVAQYRFMWACFPAMCFLAAAGARPARRFSQVAASLALIWFGLGSVVTWQNFFVQANRPIPTWIESVTRLAQGRVVMSDDPWSVVWWTPSMGVVSPTTRREDLLEVVDRYQVGYYLFCGHVPRPAPFLPEDLEIVARGENAIYYPRVWHPLRGWVRANFYHPNGPWFLARVKRTSPAP